VKATCPRCERKIASYWTVCPFCDDEPHVALVTPPPEPAPEPDEPTIIDFATLAPEPSAAPEPPAAPAPVSPAACVVLDGNHECYLVSGNEMILGRDPAVCHVALNPHTDGAPDDARAAGISRRHCRVRIEGSRAFVRNVSMLGLAVDGRNVPRNKETELTNGATLDVAGVVGMHARVQREGNEIAALVFDDLEAPPRRTYALVRTRARVGSATLEHDAWTGEWRVG